MSVTTTFFSIFCVISTSVGALALAKIFYNNKRNKLWRPVGRVKELAIYPLKFGKRISLPKVYCTRSGLKSMENQNLQDGCIIIYEKTSKTVVMDEILYFENLKIEYRLDGFMLKAPNCQSMVIPFNNLDTSFTMIMVHLGDVIPVRDCGEAAAAWVSQIFPEKNQDLRLGYYSTDCKNNKRLKKSYKDFIKMFNLFTRNTVIIHPNLSNPVLINEDSIAGVSTIINKAVNPSNFKPNILIQSTPSCPLEEYKWKKLKIGNVEFDCIKPCKRCIIAQNCLITNSIATLDIMPKFMVVLKKALQKYADFKVRDIPFVGISLQLCGEEGVIEVNDEVYIL